MNYYRRYSGDYLRDTSRLNLTEHGAYTLLMDYYYAEEKPLPEDKNELYLMVRAMRPEDQAAVDKVLNIYFFLQDGAYHQKRIDHEISVSKQARENGGGGGRPKGSKKTGIETGNKTGLITGTGTGGNTGEGTGEGGGLVHPPTTNLQPPTTSPQGTSQPATAGSSKPSVPACPHLEIIALYNRILPTARQVNPDLWNGARAKALQVRWREQAKRQNLAWWEKFFNYIAESDFLTGKTQPAAGRPPFELSLDWIVNPTNIAKIIEGAYHR